MSGPAPISIVVTPRQQAILARVVRRPTSPQREVWRAQVVLAAAEPQDKNQQIAQRLHLARETVRRWRQRWAQAQPALATVEAAHRDDDAELIDLVLALLADQPRSGAPSVFTPEQIVQIVALACEPPDASQRPVSHWTPRELAEEAVQRGIVAQISPRSVGRFLKSGGSPAALEPVLAQR